MSVSRPATPVRDAGTTMTFLSLLIRGLAAGLLAGLLAGAFAYVVGEPHMDTAIAIEEAAKPPVPGAEDAMVSRAGQRGGLILATTLYGVAIGGVLATGYGLLRRRLRTHSDTAAAMGLAAAGFLGLVLVPFLKYPPNPPGASDPETITRRTVAYLLTLLIGLTAVWFSVAAARRVPSGGPAWLRLVAGGAALVATVSVAYVFLPQIDEVPAGFPASLLWQFRLSSLGTQAVLWAVLGIAFTALLERASAARTERGMA